MRIFIDYEIFFKLNIVTVAQLVESCATVFFCVLRCWGVEVLGALEIDAELGAKGAQGEEEHGHEEGGQQIDGLAVFDVQYA